MFCYIKLNKIYILGGTSVCSRGPNTGTIRSKFCGTLFSLDLVKENADMPVCGKLIRFEYVSISQFILIVPFIPLNTLYYYYVYQIAPRLLLWVS